MEKEQMKKFIAEKVSAGLSLSKIQELLASEQGVRITFMELRMIAAEIESVDWSKTDKPEPKPTPKELSKDTPQDEGGEPPQEEDFEEELPQEEGAAAAADPLPQGDGKTKVELNKIVKPGAVASGTVTFASGVTAEWFIDQMGRLGLGKASGKPDAKDIEGFQMELQRLFSQQGM